MNKERLIDFRNKLTEFAQLKLPTFNLSSFISGKESPTVENLTQNPCGTTACAVGLLPAFYPDTFVWGKYFGIFCVVYRQTKFITGLSESFTTSKHYFELTDNDWDFLFEPSTYLDANDLNGCVLPDLTDPMIVVNRINQLLERETNESA